jgi:hypothetical protein
METQSQTLYIGSSAASKTDLSIIQQLEHRLNGLLHQSEGEFPYQLIFWGIQDSAEMSTEKVLTTFKFAQRESLKSIEMQSAGFAPSLRSQQNDFHLLKNRFETIISSLSPRLIAMELFKLKPAASAILLLAEGRDYWLSTTVKFNSQYTGIPLACIGFPNVATVSPMEPLAELVESYSDILGELQALSNLTETASDQIEGLACFIAKNRADAFEQSILQTNLCTWENALCFDFFDNPKSGASAAARWKSALQQLQEEVSEWRTWYFTNETHDILALGKLLSGNFLGIRTEAVWT